jgi:hypothetical protein
MHYELPTLVGSEHVPSGCRGKNGKNTFRVEGILTLNFFEIGS